uniref:Uncharacterized protein n=1 Tax=viral metagenome TaxID=1070528 RepID=A0A6H1ZSV9_9ZZZZ
MKYFRSEIEKVEDTVKELMNENKALKDEIAVDPAIVKKTKQELIDEGYANTKKGDVKIDYI